MAAAVVVAAVGCPWADAGGVRVNPAPTLMPRRFGSQAFQPQGVPQPFVVNVPPAAPSSQVVQQQQQQQQQVITSLQPGTPSGGPLPCPSRGDSLVSCNF